MLSLFGGGRDTLGRIAVVEEVEVKVVGGVAGLLEAVESEVVEAAVIVKAVKYSMSVAWVFRLGRGG